MEKPREKQAKAAEEGQRATSGLTTKLHTTAESVMKWKTQLEGEIKQRDGKIAECQEMVKNIKNSLLSQQQHAEALSHKLQLELLRRGDINLRIETTRNICSSLQQHCSYMSETMKKCFEEKDVIKTAQVEYVSELERLIESNENCHVAVEKLTREKDELERIYLLEKSGRLKMLEDCSNLKKLFQVKMEEARTLVLNQTERATKLAEHLEVSEEKVKSLNLHNSLLEQQIQQSEELLKKKEHKLSSELGELQSLLKQKSDLLEEEMKKISSLDEQFTELSSQHQAMEAEKNYALEREVAHKMEIQELSLELQSLAQIREDTTKQIEKLVAEKSVLEERLESMAILEDEIVQLKQQLEVTVTEKESLACKLSLAEEEKNSTEQALEQCRKDLQELNSEFAKVKTDLETLSEANKDLQQNVESKEAALLKELETNRQLQESLDLQMQENGHLQKSLESLSSASACEIGEMSKQLRELNGSLAKTKSQLKQKQDLVSNMTVETTATRKRMSQISNYGDRSLAKRKIVQGRNGPVEKAASIRRLKSILSIVDSQFLWQVVKAEKEIPKNKMKGQLIEEAMEAAVHLALDELDVVFKKWDDLLTKHHLDQSFSLQLRVYKSNQREKFANEKEDLRLRVKQASANRKNEIARLQKEAEEKEKEEREKKTKLLFEAMREKELQALILEERIKREKYALELQLQEVRQHRALLFHKAKKDLLCKANEEKQRWAEKEALRKAEKVAMLKAKEERGPKGQLKAYRKAQGERFHQITEQLNRVKRTNAPQQNTLTIKRPRLSLAADARQDDNDNQQLHAQGPQDTEADESE